MIAGDCGRLREIAEGVAEIAEKMRKRPRSGRPQCTNPRNEKALTNQGSNVFKMAEAMTLHILPVYDVLTRPLERISMPMRLFLLCAFTDRHLVAFFLRPSLTVVSPRTRRQL